MFLNDSRMNLRTIVSPTTPFVLFYFSGREYLKYMITHLLFYLFVLCLIQSTTFKDTSFYCILCLCIVFFVTSTSTHLKRKFLTPFTVRVTFLPKKDLLKIKCHCHPYVTLLNLLFLIGLVLLFSYRGSRSLLVKLWNYFE